MDWVIVLAAGRGVRAGGPKALHIVNGRAWWCIQQERLELVRLPVVWVVSERVRAGMMKEGQGPECVVVADEMAPMFASVAAGCRAIASRGGETRGVFVLPVDVPTPGASVFAKLIDGRGERGGVAAVVPTFEGRRGHPVHLGWDFVVSKVLPAAMSEDVRLDRLIEADRADVEVADAEVLVNLNTAEEFLVWVERSLRGK